VNYTWHGRAPAEAAQRSGERAGHVYMGVDVYGRGTWGGGGFRSAAAVSAAFHAGTLPLARHWWSR
jgi:mannosyl-glycoprotein endo-beta-N-acetylglucosaminidase